MRVSMSAIVFLACVIFLSIFVANVANLIAIDVDDHVQNSETLVPRDQPKKFNIGNSKDHLMWFLQISDIHISIFKDSSRITQFKEFCDLTVGAVRPYVVLASGDLTDAKTKDAMGSKQDLNEWKHYKRVLEESGVTKKTIWLDVRGNHDSFNVMNLKDPENYYLNFSVQGKKHSRSYTHQISVGSEKYSFIAVDACLEPGPKRPFNFIGFLDENEINKIKKLTEETKRLESDYTIWFGHYPTSSILSNYENGIRQIISKHDRAMAYLCGHYHTLGGLSPEMYTLQRGGYLELELADWKENRMFRLGAIDHGQFSFIDVKHGEWPVVLVTNPKHALYAMPQKENIRSIADSTHIRILAFSISAVKTVSVKINEEHWVSCRNVEGPLYVIEWDASLYKRGVHHIYVKVVDYDERVKEIVQPFSLDGTRLSFRVFPRFILMADATSIFVVSFGIILLIDELPLCIFKICHKLCLTNRMQRPRIRLRCLNAWIRKFWILSTIDRIFYPLVLYPLYLVIGPWAAGEVIKNQFGVIFAWGMYIGKSYLPGSFTFAYGFFQLFSFHLPLTFILAHTVDRRYQLIGKPHPKPSTLFELFSRHLAFTLLIAMQTSMAYFFWLAYGTLATVLCPFRTWSIIMALVLWHQANRLPKSYFRSAAIVWSPVKQFTMGD